MTNLKEFAIYHFPFAIFHFWEMAESTPVAGSALKMENERWKMANGKFSCSHDEKRNLEK
jgi:hypothetical protein